MGKRHTGRKLAMQIIYQAELRNTDPAGILSTFWEVHPFTPETREWASELSRSCWAYKPDIDAIIQRLAIDWDITRINPIDKAVLRLGIYELKYEHASPSVVINEALEISKKYATDDSPRFVNGILGQFVKECSPESSQVS